MPQPAVVVPVKDFTEAKRRLAPRLDPADRSRLARDMAETVLRAAAPLTTFVVCDTDAVRAWAVDAGAEVCWTPGLGLNGAVEAGIHAAGAAGFTTAIVAHADLPLARSLAFTAVTDGVTIVPDRRLDGSNVVTVPTAAGFSFSYGPGSFARHRAEASRLGLRLRIIRDERLGWDVDHPRDLALPAHL